MGKCVRKCGTFRSWGLIVRRCAVLCIRAIDEMISAGRDYLYFWRNEWFFKRGIRIGQIAV